METSSYNVQIFTIKSAERAPHIRKNSMTLRQIVPIVIIAWIISAIIRDIGLQKFIRQLKNNQILVVANKICS